MYRPWWPCVISKCQGNVSLALSCLQTQQWVQAETVREGDTCWNSWRCLRQCCWYWMPSTSPVTLGKLCLQWLRTVWDAEVIDPFFGFPPSWTHGLLSHGSPAGKERMVTGRCWRLHSQVKSLGVKGNPVKPLICALIRLGESIPVVSQRSHRDDVAYVYSLWIVLGVLTLCSHTTSVLLCFHKFTTQPICDFNCTAPITTYQALPTVLSTTYRPYPYEFLPNWTVEKGPSHSANEALITTVM